MIFIQKTICILNEIRICNKHERLVEFVFQYFRNDKIHTLNAGIEIYQKEK